jgi:hypothetical protein
MIKSIHGLIAYLFLISTVTFVIFSLISFLKKSDFRKTNMTLVKLAFISSHLQLALGLLLWWSQGYLSQLSQDTKSVMGDKALRILAVEHPVTNILAIALITIGFISIKKSALDQTKHLKGIIYFGIALLLILSRIPYHSWLNL